MTDQAFTLVPVERLDRMESLLRDLASRLEGATVTPAPEWLTLNEYAKRIGKTRRTVKNWKDAGKLETKIENGETLVRVSPNV